MAALGLLPATGPSATGSCRPINLRHRAARKAFELTSLSGRGAGRSENSGRPLPSATGCTPKSYGQPPGGGPELATSRYAFHPLPVLRNRTRYVSCNCIAAPDP